MSHIGTARRRRLVTASTDVAKLGHGDLARDSPVRRRRIPGSTTISDNAPDTWTARNLLFRLLLVVIVGVVLVVVMRMGVSHSLVGMFVGVLAILIELVIMRMLVMTVVVGMLVFMGNFIVAMRVRVVHRDLLRFSIRNHSKREQINYAASPVRQPHCNRRRWTTGCRSLTPWLPDRRG